MQSVKHQVMLCCIQSFKTPTRTASLPSLLPSFQLCSVADGSSATTVVCRRSRSAAGIAFHAVSLGFSANSTQGFTDGGLRSSSPACAVWEGAIGSAGNSPGSSRNFSISAPRLSSSSGDTGGAGAGIPALMRAFQFSGISETGGRGLLPVGATIIGGFGFVGYIGSGSFHASPFSPARKALASRRGGSFAPISRRDAAASNRQQ